MSQSLEGEVAVSVTINKGKILIMKRSKKTSSSGKWAFPGGKIREDEEASEAVLRELDEETGLNGKIRKKGEPCIDGGELGRWKLHPFLIETDKRKVELNHEHSDYRWVEKDEIEDLDTLGELKAFQRFESVLE